VRKLKFKRPPPRVLHPINRATLCLFSICMRMLCKNSLARPLTGTAHKTFYRACTIYYANSPGRFIIIIIITWSIKRSSVVDMGHFCCAECFWLALHVISSYVLVLWAKQHILWRGMRHWGQGRQERIKTEYVVVVILNGSLEIKNKNMFFFCK
jgi:hypothetical protein